MHSVSGSAALALSHSSNLAVMLGFQRGQVVQEIGFDDDVDGDFRDSIEEVIGSYLVDDDYDDVADAVML